MEVYIIGLRNGVFPVACSTGGLEAEPMQIEIFSDVVCPWCYIGKRRLDAVLQTPVGEGVTLRWRPYQLRPGLPAKGVDRAEYLRARYGEEADPGRVPQRLAAEAEDAGLTFDFAAMGRMPNTFQAHRLMELAWDDGVQHQLAEVLFDAYFRAGKDIGQLATLVEAAERSGIDGAKAAQYLDGDAGADRVREQLERAVELGVSGVPSYLLAGRFTLPGAQTPEVMGQFIQRAKERLA
ncbi:MAG: DsbA family oxidoreductase [Gammaproteobacteria bacterium]|nr:DsbA family oxidoreductase [Gammaproteobacteria bacterium]MYH15783.1 DsbA family oxidoreductase [Gammaproteobacteria bacterium]MYK81833.1 DsbA family oxidoreductase [Gammaproteobacteria bacterium]